MRLRYVVAVRIHPRQRVVAFGGAEINQHARRFLVGGSEGLGGIDDFRQRLDGGFKFGRLIGGVLPNLISVRRQIHFTVGVAVEDAGFFVVEIEELLFLSFVLKEGFVRADDFRVFTETLANAGA